MEETSCGQISQLDIHQLLSTSPQVIYASGLNGYDEPVITTLPELLSSSTSVIASKHAYLEFDIPTNEESDTKVLPIGNVSIIQTTNLHNPPPNPEGSIAAEVNHLLDQAMAEASSHESKQSSLEKITEAAATMSLPQKSEVTVPLVDTSSQASMEKAEGFLEGIPTNISPVADVYSSRSVSPPVDPSELQANANRATDNMLHLKRSLDVKRQRAIWELGSILCQNESQGAALVTAVRSSVPRQSWRPKLITEQLSWRPRQPNTIQFKQLRQPVPKPSVMPKPRQPLRLQCFRRNTAITCRA